MSVNKYKKNEKKEKPGNEAIGKTTRFFSALLDGSFIEKNTTASVIPFIIYLSGLALFLIFNTYYAEKKARELDTLRTEIIELRINYISTKSHYMHLTNRSELAERLSSRGFIEPVSPPVIVYDQSESGNILQRVLGRSR